MTQRSLLLIGKAVLIALGVFVLGAGSVHSQNAGDVAAGHSLANDVCAECHGVEPLEFFSPHLSAPAFQEVANTGGMTALMLSAWLNSSHPTMPNFKINRSDQADLIVYILSLKAQ
jgi:mono/diheme cytochrome c family protein